MKERKAKIIEPHQHLSKRARALTAIPAEDFLKRLEKEWQSFPVVIKITCCGL
jgi:hypothetical protein